MRSILVLTGLMAGLAHAADGYNEQRSLTLGAGDFSRLTVNAGAGSMEISGVENLDQIEIEANIVVPGWSEDRARRKMEKDMVLSLEELGDEAVLHSYFESRGWGFGDSPRIDLVVRVPARLNLRIDDGSGYVNIDEISGDVDIEDGSGSLTLTNIGGSIRIDDGSGSIDVRGAGGDVRIDDGSGGITVRDVKGSVVLDDGSGSIRVEGVEADLIIEDDGSGSLSFADIGGKVEKET